MLRVNRESYSITLTVQDQEYSLALGVIVGITMNKRTPAADVRFAFETGKVATSIEPFFTLHSTFAEDYGQAWMNGGTLYLAGDAGTVVEVVVYRAAYHSGGFGPYLSDTLQWLGGITLSADVQSLLQAADDAAIRAAIGLGSMALQAASAVAITGGTIAGVAISGSTIPNSNVTGLGTMATQAASAVAITGGTISGVTSISTPAGAGHTPAATVVDLTTSASKYVNSSNSINKWLFYSGGGNFYGVGMSDATGFDCFSGNRGFAWFTGTTALIGTGATRRMTLTNLGNLCVGVDAAGTSATATLAIGNGTEPTTGPADSIQLSSVDLSAGNTIPALRTEGTGIISVGTPAANAGSIAIKINGTVRYIPYAATAAV